MIATYNNHKDIILTLLANGADKNIKDKVIVINYFYNSLVWKKSYK